jgi:CAAX prenyl protease-like protein
MISNHDSPSSDRGAIANPPSSEKTHPAAPTVDQNLPTAGEVFPYLVPMFAYVGLSSLENYLPRLAGGPSPSWYPLAYTAKLGIVILLAFWSRSTWNDFRPAPKSPAIGLAVLCGLLVWGLWIGLDGRYPKFSFLGSRTEFNADALAPAARWSFIGIRLLGLALVVPVIEELFWRSFLMRWLIDPDFFKVQIGRVTPLAAVTTSVLFALAHPEWLPALLTGLLWAGLLWLTKSLGVCAVSHSVANLALGIYVIVTGDWKFW